MDLAVQTRECGGPHDRGKGPKTLKRPVKATSQTYHCKNQNKILDNLLGFRHITSYFKKT